MNTRPSSILRSMVLGGLVVSALARLLILFTASPVPDPASGRTVPSLFAPQISSDWDYITPLQNWLMIVLASATLACFVAWVVVAWRERRQDAAGTQSRRMVGRQGR
jgi:hypothetical protein